MKTHYLELKSTWKEVKKPERPKQCQSNIQKLSTVTAQDPQAPESLWRFLSIVYEIGEDVVYMWFICGLYGPCGL